MRTAPTDTPNSAQPHRAPHLRLALQLALAILLAASVPLAAHAQSAAGCPAHRALTLDQVLNFVNQKIPEDRTLQFIESCKVSFPMNAPTVEKLAQAGASEKILDTLNQITAAQLTLDQAKSEVAELTAFMQSEPSGAQHEAALKSLDADYQSQKTQLSNPAPKGQFEPTRDYEARITRAKTDLANLDRKHESDRAALDAQFSAQTAASDKPYQSRIGFLQKTTYPDALKATYAAYNPDTGQLTAKVGSDPYNFDNVPPKTAEAFYKSWKQVQVRQPFADDGLHRRVLALGSESVPGYSVAAKAAIDQQASAAETRRKLRAALIQARTDLTSHNYDAAQRDYQSALALDPSNSEAASEIAAIQNRLQRQASLLQEQKAAGVWVDPDHQRMWTLQDNGSDISWKSAGEYCQALRTGGNSDWRLPSTDEFEPMYRGGVTRMTQAHTHTNITFLTSNTGQIAQKVNVPAKAYHIAGDIQLTEVLLWSSSKGNDKGQYLLADFHEGHYAEDLPNSKRDYRALCVRTYAPPADVADLAVPTTPLPAAPDGDPPTPAVVVAATGNQDVTPPNSEKGYYTDQATGRSWLLQDNGVDIDWRQAKNYCASQRTGGFSNWRVPSLKEIESIYDPRATQTIQRPTASLETMHVYEPHPGPYTFHIAGAISRTTPYLWSSEVDLSRGHTYFKFFRFEVGQWDSSPPEEKSLHRVLCVR
jgi:hypothetical protein